MLINVARAGNSCIVDIEIKACSPVFVNLQINLILCDMEIVPSQVFSGVSGKV